MPLMTLVDYAATHGASKQAATGWKTRGALVFSGGRVDSDASDRNMEAIGLGRFRVGAHGGRRAAGVHGLPDRPGADSAPVPVAATIGPEETAAQAAERIVLQSGAMPIAQALAIKETYLALSKKLEYDLAVGKVVLASDVATVVGKEYGQLRQHLLAIPTNIAPALLRLKTAAEIEALVRDRVIEAMEALCADGGGQPSGIPDGTEPR